MSRCNSCHRDPSRRIQPFVEVMASGIISTKAMNPMVMNGRLATSFAMNPNAKN
jgi:hypothetical protein